MDELLARHRKEQKELQNKITSKKKNATKKTRKGVNDECDALVRDLQERQKAEVEALDPPAIEDAVENLDLNGGQEHNTSQSVALDEPREKVEFDSSTKNENHATPEAIQQGSKKPNRQKARLARRAAEQEAQAVAAAEEAANLPDLRDQELKSMKSQMERFNLKETYIRPDGHCLYSAVAHGMSQTTTKTPSSSSQTYQSVRATTADFISQHPSNFEAFLEEPLDLYVKKIKDTAEWGGQLELQAISRAYGVDINVLQADGRVEKIHSQGGQSGDNEIWLAYYRHSFGLGEHYNALSKADKG